MNDLSTLLHTASEHAPLDRIDPQALVRAGRARVRRRRAIGGIGVAAAAAMAVAIPVITDSPDTHVQPLGQPGQVLTLADASPAQNGVDYDVLSTFKAHVTDGGFQGQFVRAVLPDGTVVVQSYPDGRGTVSRISLVRNGDTRTVDAPRWLENYLGATPTGAIFGDGKGSGVWLLDLTALTWRHTLEQQDVDTNVPAQPLTASEARPNQIYVAASAMAQAERREILRADLSQAAGSRLATGGDVAAFGGHIAWTATHDAPNERVVLRDETTGKDTSFDPHTGRCDQKALGLTTDRVVVMVNCADAGKEQSETDVVDRIDVFDLDGKPLARITGDELGPVRMTDRFITISSWNKDEAGTYTYDLTTGRFLMVEKTMSGLTGRETGSGATLVWQQRLDGERGATYVVAQMR